MRIELTYEGFADLRLTTWLTRPTIAARIRDGDAQPFAFYHICYRFDLASFVQWRCASHVNVDPFVLHRPLRLDGGAFYSPDFQAITVFFEHLCGKYFKCHGNLEPGVRLELTKNGVAIRRLVASAYPALYSRFGCNTSYSIYTTRFGGCQVRCWIFQTIWALYADPLYRLSHPMIVKLQVEHRQGTPFVVP